MAYVEAMVISFDGMGLLPTGSDVIGLHSVTPDSNPSCQSDI